MLYSHFKLYDGLVIHNNVYRFDVILQVRMVIEVNLRTFMMYRHSIQCGELVDVISSSPQLSDTNPYIVHLVLCADGTSVLKTKSNTFWPLQLIILDLSLHVRQKFYNRVLYILCSTKPKWDALLNNLAADLSQTFSVTINDVCYKFQLKLYKCIFDLPGLASVCNVTQYNGAYGCPFCLHPGKQVVVGRGSSRKYPFVTDLPSRTDSHYRQCLASVAHGSNGTKVFWC